MPSLVVGRERIGIGKVFVYRRDEGGVDNWGEVTKILASDGATDDEFGSSVSISGDTAIVGAYRDDDNAGESGSAYVYRRDEGGLDNWGEVFKITASDASANDNFGISVGPADADIAYHLSIPAQDEIGL